MAKRSPATSKTVGEVLDMGYHRNGVSGRGFWTILFKGHRDAEGSIASHRFVATFFPKEEDEDGEGQYECVAVLRVSDLIKGNAEMAWRGDHFEDELRHLVDSYVWRHDRTVGVQCDGAGREITNRREAIRAQKAKKASRS